MNSGHDWNKIETWPTRVFQPEIASSSHCGHARDPCRCALAEVGEFLLDGKATLEGEARHSARASSGDALQKWCAAALVLGRSCASNNV